VGVRCRFLTQGPFILIRQYLMAKQLSTSAKDTVATGQDQHSRLRRAGGCRASWQLQRPLQLLAQPGPSPDVKAGVDRAVLDGLRQVGTDSALARNVWHAWHEPWNV
jgi:hypothetical protein